MTDSNCRPLITKQVLRLSANRALIGGMPGNRTLQCLLKRQVPKPIGLHPILVVQAGFEPAINPRYEHGGFTNLPTVPWLSLSVTIRLQRPYQDRASPFGLTTIVWGVM